MSPGRENHGWLRTAAIDRFDYLEFRVNGTIQYALFVSFMQNYFSEAHPRGDLSQSFVLFRCRAALRYIHRLQWMGASYCWWTLSFPTGAAMSKAMKVLLLVFGARVPLCLLGAHQSTLSQFSKVAVPVSTPTSQGGDASHGAWSGWMQPSWCPPSHLVLISTKRGFKFTEIYPEFASVNSSVSTNKLFSEW